MLNTAGEPWDWPLIRKRCTAEALRMLRRQQEAEEVVQEALARAWRSKGSCRTPEAPLPWCLQITRNEALRVIGRQRASRTEVLELASEVTDQRSLDEGDLTLMRIDLYQALRKLSDQEQTLILLRYTQDCSHPEIAARLEIPEATARVRLHRAHKRLRSLLDDPV